MNLRSRLAASALVAGTIAGGVIAAAPANAVSQGGCVTNQSFVIWTPSGSPVCFNGTNSQGGPVTGLHLAAQSYNSNSYHGFIDGNFGRVSFWYGSDHCIVSSCATEEVADVNLAQ